MNIHIIKNNNIIYSDSIYLLKEFSKNNLSKHFRYFNKFNSSTDFPLNMIQNHIYTIIGSINNSDNNSIIPIAYGHIDYENNNWLGICILDDYQNKGYGKKIMNNLLQFVNINDINPLFLTVDIDNSNAIHLYKKFNFSIFESSDTFIKMIYKNTLL
jgi:RimJ/RimL family protein N-acetyltransferase